MHPQLQAIVVEFQDANARLRHLAEAVPDELWTRRAQADRWSMAECLVHLNLTGAAFVPRVRQALEEGGRLDVPAPARYRRDPIGWLLWRTMGPPVRMRVRTTAPFLPTATAPLAELTAEFERLQAEQIALVEAADGLPLHRMRIHSPFNERITYNLYSALTILPRHQHRHLWQAEQGAAQLRDGAPGD